MKHIVIINQVLGLFFHDMVERLAAEGWRVTVFTGECNLRQTEGDSLFQVHPCPKYDRRSTRSRWRSWNRFCRYAERELPRLDAADIFLVSSNPPIAAWRLLRPNILGRAKCVLRILDIYPEVVSNRLPPVVRQVFERFWLHRNRRAYRRSSVVMTLGPVMAQTLARHVPFHPDVIPDWCTIDPAEVPPREANRFRAEHGLGEDCVVLYSGNIGISHDLGILLDAADRLRDVAGLKFVIIGEGAAKAGLMETARARGLDAVRFLPFQPEERLPESLSSGDLACVSVTPGAEAALMPCKTYNNMAAGSGILAVTRQPSDLANIVTTHQCGRVVEPGDAEGLSHAIRELVLDCGEIRRMGDRARSAAVNHYSRDKCLDQLMELLDRVSAETDS